MGQQLQCRFTDGLIIELPITGGIKHCLATECRCLGIWCVPDGASALREGHVSEFRQMCPLVDARNGLDQRSCETALARRSVGKIGEDRAQFSIGIGFSQPLVHEAGLTLAIFDRPRAQHQMWKIEIELVGRDIGAFRHETHVAQGAGISDRLEIGGLEMLDILIGTLVDQVEQLRKAVAQVETASATMTNIEYATQFCIKVGFVVKRLLLPGNRVPGGGVKAAFAHG